MPKPIIPPICPYCGKASERITGAVLYPNRPDLAEKIIYRCEPCDAWVTCHPGTANPLGRLANAELRKAKSAAHIAFDPLWKRKILRAACSKSAARKAGYRWLAAQLGMDPKLCHIGMMDVADCQRVVAVCSPYVEHRQSRAVRS